MSNQEYVVGAFAGHHGSFKQALYKAIAIADSENRRKLAIAFPQDVARLVLYEKGE